MTSPNHLSAVFQIALELTKQHILSPEKVLESAGFGKKVLVLPHVLPFFLNLQSHILLFPGVFLIMVLNSIKLFSQYLLSKQP